MVVKAQLKGNAITGLRIEAKDVRRYFPETTRVIELELDHLQIQCGLSPQFWQGEPEIRDPRLCGWLDSKVIHRKGRPKEVRLAMTPAGNNVFKLRSSPVGDGRATSMEPLNAL